MKKWVNIIIGFVIISAFVFVFIWLTPDATYDITIDEAVELINSRVNDDDFVILDLRTPKELESGIIKNAQSLDFLAPRFKERLAALDKKKTYLIYCASGYRSNKAKLIMKEAGFDKIYNMSDGMSEWYKRRLPISRPG